MAVPVYYTGDTWPPLSGTAKDASGVAVDLSTSTSMRMVAKQVDGAAVIAGTAAFVSTGSDGKWKYVWQSGDLATAASYCPELEVTWGTGRIETFRDDAVTFLVKADND